MSLVQPGTSRPKPQAKTPRNDEIIRLRATGEGPRAIARLVGCTPGIVSGVLFRAGMTEKPVPQGRKPRPPKPPRAPREPASVKAAVPAKPKWVGDTDTLLRGGYSEFSVAQELGVSDRVFAGWRS